MVPLAIGDQRRLIAASRLPNCGILHILRLHSLIGGYMVRPARRFTLIELLVVMVIIAILSALLLPVLSRAKEKVRQGTCTANMKSLAMASLLYCGDYGNYFPNVSGPQVGSGAAAFGDWQPLGAKKYLANTDDRLWSCPSVSAEKSDCSFSNYRYIGSGRRDDNDCAAAVTLGFDASGNHPQNQWMNAIFLDGHVEGAVPNGLTVLDCLSSGVNYAWRWNRNDW